ncbi:P2R1A-PPP2R2A-interacting phosphatase regulator 1 isoform X2 [Lepisosteus oculatus]|uniref:P2R1A-PPP2R2A-interacting phosphatase regulator 1 isoform X2 n=1 Tax=Lepisosteus oculatus TaxID=7918 RepID=UPI00073FB715|nr:PREDICTED: protein FAM122A-like isoform X2 [Lepisosteus oculatus]
MERMEVDQCAGAAAGSGGGALRRSNSAPMITGVSDGMAVFSSGSTARYRRSSVSVNLGCPGLALPLSPFPLVCGLLEHSKQRVSLSQDECMEPNPRGAIHRQSVGPPPPECPWEDHRILGLHSLDSGITPNSSPSPTRRFKNRGSVSPAVRWPVLTPLKRKGGVESDGPPKKLFVTGVTDPPHLTGYTVSVAPAGSSPVGMSGCVPPQGSPLSLAISVPTPPSFTPQHPGM